MTSIRPIEGRLPTCSSPASCPLVIRHARDTEKLEAGLDYARRLYELQRHLIRCLDGERAATRMWAEEVITPDWDRDWLTELREAMLFCQGRTSRARAALKEVGGL